MRTKNKKPTRITEKQLAAIIKKVINEQDSSEYDDNEDEKEEYTKFIEEAVYDSAMSIIGNLSAVINDNFEEGIDFALEDLDYIKKIIIEVKTNH
jgi:hypothetical protein